MTQIITAQEGKVYRRIHDDFIMGRVIHLGYDYSTGVQREDKPEYYEEIDEPIADDGLGAPES